MISFVITPTAAASDFEDGPGHPGWRPCFDFPEYDRPVHDSDRRWVVSRAYVNEPVRIPLVTPNPNPTATTMEASYEQTHSLETTVSVGGSLEKTKVVNMVLQAGWAQTVVDSSAIQVKTPVLVQPRNHMHVQPWATKLHIRYAVQRLHHYYSDPVMCRWEVDPHIRTAVVPVTSTVCIWESPVAHPGSSCPPERRGYGNGGGGAPPGGGTSGPPAGPLPVTSVVGLADGTLLATSDTRRIYKMVGGAPVWQATCDDGICNTTPRPTTQGVIDAGPSVPRNGSTIVDQLGRVHMIVGGAPVHLETCAAPVTCGSPVKMSTWSVDNRDHMNRVPADGHLVQAKAGDRDLPVAATVGGALIPFESPQELIDAGYGSDWASRVVAISPGAYGLLGTIPANGTLVQGASGGQSTPVAAVIGGAAISFASADEVVEAGYGADWRSKVRGIPARHFNRMPRVPSDGTLVQGTPGVTPAAAIMGGARVDFASSQEVVDSGFGTDWGRRLNRIPTRAFNILPTQFIDGTRLGRVGNTAEAAVVGGARVDLQSAEERSALGLTDRPLHILPVRAWDAMPTTIGDGTRLGKPGSTSEAAVIGGARVDLWSATERDSIGYDRRPLQLIPARVWDAMPTTIRDGSIVGRPDQTSQAVIAGGAVVPFHTIEELQASGYGSEPLQITPARVWDSLPTTIGDGTRIGKAGSGGEAAVIGAARVALHSAAERDSIGYGQKPLITIPVRVWDALPTEIRDGTRIGKAGATAEAVTVGGARVAFQSGAELVESGYGNKPLYKVPVRIWDALPTEIRDGTRIGKAGATAEAVTIGGARVVFQSGAELVESGYGNKPMYEVPVRVWDALPTEIRDGTRIGKAGSSAEAVTVGGARVVFQSGAELVESGYGDKPMYEVPVRVWDALPTEIRDGTRIGKASSTAEAVTVGGARVVFQSGAELVESGYGDKPMYEVPIRVWDAISTTIGDGTYIKAPSSSDVWLVLAGRRAASDQVDGVWVIPERVMESIPID